MSSSLRVVGWAILLCFTSLNIVNYIGLRRAQGILLAASKTSSHIYCKLIRSVSNNSTFTTNFHVIQRMSAMIILLNYRMTLSLRRCQSRSPIVSAWPLKTTGPVSSLKQEAGSYSSAQKDADFLSPCITSFIAWMHFELQWFVPNIISRDFPLAEYGLLRLRPGRSNLVQIFGTMITLILTVRPARAHSIMRIIASISCVRCSCVLPIRLWSQPPFSRMATAVCHWGLLA